MNRRSFLKVLCATIAAPFVKVKKQDEVWSVTTESYTSDAAGTRALWGLPEEDDDSHDCGLTYSGLHERYYNPVIGIATKNTVAGDPAPIFMYNSNSLYLETKDEVIPMMDGVFEFDLKRDVSTGDLVFLHDLVNS